MIEKEITNLLWDNGDDVDRISETIDLDYYYYQSNENTRNLKQNNYALKTHERKRSSDKSAISDIQVCSFQNSLNKIGLVLDMYLRNKEYWFIESIIKKATQDDFMTLCKLFLHSSY